MNTNKILNTTAMLAIMALADLPMLSIGALAADTSEEVTELEEIVVTARKREERLRDVPASVSALTESQMELLQLDGMDDYLRQMTGVILVNSGPEYLSDVSIRGQGGGRIGFSETATALFRNGIYVAGGGFGGRSLSRMDLFDVQSVQVYRGPQGALYGRNAVGGAINVISKRPTDNFEGRVQGGYRSFDRLEFEGILNIPLVEDQLAVRLGGFWFDQNDGQVTNVNTGQALDRRDSYGLRMVTEAKLNENLTTMLTIEYRESEAPAFSSLGYRPLRTNGTELDPSRFERDVSTDGRVEIQETTVFFEVDWDTQVGILRGTFTYKSRDGARLQDDFDHFIGFQGRAFGGTPVELLSDQNEDFSHYGGELTLTSAENDSNWNWLAGVEFQATEGDVNTTISGTGVIPPLNALLRTDIFREDLISLAIFGAVDYDLNELWNISFEARVQNDKKDFTFDRIPDNPVLTTALMVVDERKWTRVTPSVTMTYKISDDVMSYFRVATAYRPGGFNVGIPADIPDAGDLISYEPEKITSAEIGFKWSSFDNKVQSELAFFYSRTKDVQSVTSPSLTVSQFILLNSGDMDTWGIDFETRGIFEVGPGNLMVTMGASTNDGSFKDGASIITSGELIDISGLRVNRTRDYTFNLNLAYRFQVSEGLRAAISGSFQAEGGGFENVTNSRDLEGYELFDASISLSGDYWKVSLFGKNLTDEIYRLQQINLNDYFNARRTWGGSVTFTF